MARIFLTTEVKILGPGVQSRKGFTLRMATLDRLIPVCCATHFTYILEKLASEQALTLGLLAGLF